MLKMVPTLLLPAMVKACNLLMKYRDDMGIMPENNFLFPSTKLGPLPTWRVIRDVANRAGCQRPDLINTNGLRKYIATTVQVSHC